MRLSMVTDLQIMTRNSSKLTCISIIVIVSNHSFSIFLLFSSKSFSGQSFNVNEVIVDQIARLTVFYSDLDEVGSEYKVTQTSVVNEQALKDAISDFSNVIEDFKKQLPTKHSYSSNKQI
jgi:hypothetical protein